MVIEKPILPTWEWLWGGTDAVAAGAFFEFIKVAFVLVLLGLILGLLVSVFRYGPGRGWSNYLRVLRQAPRDLLGISPRRVLGLAVLAMREAIRRRVWVALILFFVVLMFASWNLAPNSDQPAVIYLNFVLTAATYIMLPVAVFTAAFSLPQDIKNHTIYTVVTKPVRPSEIVLGRILGFSFVGTALLLAMGLSSYIFVVRGLDHTHTLTDQDLLAETHRGRVVRNEGETSNDDRHRHPVDIEARSFYPEFELSSTAKITRVGPSATAIGLRIGDQLIAIDGEPVADKNTGKTLRRLAGRPMTDVPLSLKRDGKRLDFKVPRTILETFSGTNRGHKHRIVARQADGSGNTATYTVGPAEGMFLARVPQYGSLRFRDSKGDPKDSRTWTFNEQGVNVGKIFSYRSYIRGNTLAAAIWTFDDLTPGKYPNGLDMDVSIRVYRSYLGKIDAAVVGSLYVRNPETGKRSREQIFSGKDFAIERMRVSRKVWSMDDELIDLFADGLVTPDGRTEVWISCVDPGQYFGMAEADVYIRARDAPFTLNFIKGFMGIELQIILVTALAVLFSTFLSGPVSTLLSFTTVLLGFNKDFLQRVVQSVLNPEVAQQAVAYKRVYGGGPIEAAYRILLQLNITSELETNPLTSAIKVIDKVVMYVVNNILHLLADFEQFLEVQYLSYGYDIPWDMLIQHSFSVLSFMLATYILGYFILKSRELAR
ncbi:MAG: PDZ domain-containing protein [Pirellulales bacterium]|nr:PDZ domain-containing protein [Pirellulales bacterium]